MAMTDADRGEAGIEEKFAHYLELARSLPTIDVNDPRIQGILTAQNTFEKVNAELDAERAFAPFGNNFDGIFIALRAKRLNPQSDLMIISAELEPMEALGEPWQIFLAGNGALLADIDAALGEQEPFRDLMGFHRDMLFEPRVPRGKKFEMSDALLSAPNHPLGIEAVSYYYHDKLNPLLKRAWVAMREVGIDLGYTPRGL